MGTRGIVPNLVLSQRVIEKMALTASQYMEDETGEAMVGIVEPGKNTNGVPTIYVLDTISPDESAVRQSHTFQQGDERQDELIWWLQENWRERRDYLRETASGAAQAKWDEPLRYLGDWHKQPGYMIAPSGGDLMTAMAWLDDDENEMNALLVPIVTVGHPATTATSDAQVNYITAQMDDGSFMRVDWWYIHRDVGMFQPINPVVYPTEQLPELTAYPWHLTKTDRVETEIAQLKAEGLFVSVLLEDTDKKLPLEICLLMARQGASEFFCAVTHIDYPATAPELYKGPYISLKQDETMYDIFEKFWDQAEKVDDPPDWQWTENTYLIDYLQAVEDHLGIRVQPEPINTTDTTATPEPPDTVAEDANATNEESPTTTQEEKTS